MHLVTLRKLFGETKLLSDMLQSETVDMPRVALNIFEQCDSAIMLVAKRQKMLSFSVFWSEGGRT